MSEKKSIEEKPAIDAPSAAPWTAEQFATLQEVALRIYTKHLPLGRQRGTDYLARGSYVFAVNFVRISERIRNGEETIRELQPSMAPPRLCEVRYPNPDGGGDIIRMEPEEDIFLPNEPLSHPVNQRSNCHPAKLGRPLEEKVLGDGGVTWK